MSRVVADRDRCIGSGNCGFYAPGTFELDDQLKVVVVDQAGGDPVDDPADVRAAVEGCPVWALRLVDGDEPDEGTPGGG